MDEEVIDDWQPNYSKESLLDFHEAKFTQKEIYKIMEENDQIEQNLKKEVIKLLNKRQNQQEEEEKEAEGDEISDDEMCDDINQNMKLDIDCEEFLYDPVKD